MMSCPGLVDFNFTNRPKARAKGLACTTTLSTIAHGLTTREHTSLQNIAVVF